MSLITDALRKADSSLSTTTPPPPQLQTQEPPPNPTAELPPAPSEQAPGMRLSHGLFLILCIAAGYLWFGHHSSHFLRSQKIEVIRLPRSVTRPPQAASSDEKTAERAQDPFSTALSPQTASRFPSPKSSSLPESGQAAAAAGTTIGMEMLRAVETSQWRLNGIIRGGVGKPLALVNNELVQEGDSFHGARVARVSDNQVVLDTNGQTQTLQLD